LPRGFILLKAGHPSVVILPYDILEFEDFGEVLNKDKDLKLHVPERA